MSQRSLLFLVAGVHALSVALFGLLFPSVSASLLLTPIFLEQFLNGDKLAHFMFRLIHGLVFGYAVSYFACGLRPKSTGAVLSGIVGKMFAFVCIAHAYGVGVVSEMAVFVGLTDFALAVAFLASLFV